MPLHRELSVSGVLLGTLLFTRILLAQNPAADLVLIHGHILTVDANDSVAQAIAVRHSVIVKVGTDAEVLEFAGNAPGTRIIDLHGHAATPGLIDTHAHIADGGVEELYGVKLSDAASVAEIVARVKAKIALVKPGEWVTGSGWDEGKLAEVYLLALGWLSIAVRGVRWQDLGLRLGPGWRRHLLFGFAAGLAIEALELFVTQPLLVKLTGKLPDLSVFHFLFGDHHAHCCQCRLRTRPFLSRRNGHRRSRNCRPIIQPAVSGLWPQPDRAYHRAWTWR
jgi:Amidohydrolase family